jgi:hypothetical protein
MLLLPLGVAGLMPAGGAHSKWLFLGAALVGACFWIDGMFRAKLRFELAHAADFGPRWRHDGKSLCAEDREARVRLKCEPESEVWTLEMTADVPSPATGDFAATDASLPFNVPLESFVGAKRELSPPAHWSGWRVFSADPERTRAALESVPAPRPPAQYLSLSEGRLSARWPMARPTAQDYRARSDAFVSLVRGLKAGS